ncbi:hypothetical protein HAX54_037781 [Datura stramonium]|uniref:Uncharacterized protein n=1 Tax=Datura stramonium TaxID=4076 RepID=A0ABS8SHC7_DATST|nr:hypothetical protein [Datura stramonium]
MDSSYGLSEEMTSIHHGNSIFLVEIRGKGFGQLDQRLAIAVSNYDSQLHWNRWSHPVHIYYCVSRISLMLFFKTRCRYHQGLISKWLVVKGEFQRGN